MNRGGVMIMAGGTGGHVFPALAVADALRSQSAEVFWMGTRNGMEARIVVAAGIPIEWVRISGLRGKGTVAWLLAPFRLLAAVAQALWIVARRRPAVVLGMGGFVSGPGGLAAWLLRRPLLIHEQNAVAGLTNRWLARIARRVFEAFPASFPPGVNAHTVGNPLRADILELAGPSVRSRSDNAPLHVLVLGGSQGALALNQRVPAALRMLGNQPAFEVRHQAGARTLDMARQAYEEQAVPVRLEAFIEDMAAAYAWADLVICRAGALTVSELAAAGVAAVLVPYPYSVDDHQMSNARYLADAGAAVVVPQPDCSPEHLAAVIGPLLRNRIKLREMGQTARNLARPDATRDVAQACLDALGGRT